MHWLLTLLTCVQYAAFSFNLSLAYTTSLILQANARPHYTSMSIINAQISLVPRPPLSFLLVLPVNQGNDGKKATTHSTCVCTPNNPYHTKTNLDISCKIIQWYSNYWYQMWFVFLVSIPTYSTPCSLILDLCLLLPQYKKLQRKSRQGLRSRLSMKHYLFSSG